MPTLDIQISIKGQLRENGQSSRIVKQPTTKDDWYDVHRDQVYQLYIIKNVVPVN